MSSSSDNRTFPGWLQDDAQQAGMTPQQYYALATQFSGQGPTANNRSDTLAAVRQAQSAYKALGGSQTGSQTGTTTPPPTSALDPNMKNSVGYVGAHVLNEPAQTFTIGKADPKTGVSPINWTTTDKVPGQPDFTGSNMPGLLGGKNTQTQVSATTPYTATPPATAAAYNPGTANATVPPVQGWNWNNTPSNVRVNYTDNSNPPAAPGGTDTGVARTRPPGWGVTWKTRDASEIRDASQAAGQQASGNYGGGPATVGPPVWQANTQGPNPGGSTAGLYTNAGWTAPGSRGAFPAYNTANVNQATTQGQQMAGGLGLQDTGQRVGAGAAGEQKTMSAGQMAGIAQGVGAIGSAIAQGFADRAKNSINAAQAVSRIPGPSEYVGTSYTPYLSGQRYT